MFGIVNKLNKILELQIKILNQRLKNYRQQELNWDAIEKENLETGKNFNNLMQFYAITEEELLDMSKTVCEFTTITRITNIDKYLFVDKEHKIPRQIKQLF